jgi:hypothetical protein
MHCIKQWYQNNLRVFRTGLAGNVLISVHELLYYFVLFQKPWYHQTVTVTLRSDSKGTDFYQLCDDNLTPGVDWQSDPLIDRTVGS